MSDIPLSDKVREYGAYEGKDVAEAVRKLKVSIKKLNGIFNTGTDDIFREIDKIFGDLK